MTRVGVTRLNPRDYRCRTAPLRQMAGGEPVARLCVALVNPREGGTDTLGVVDLDPASKSYASSRVRIWRNS